MDKSLWGHTAFAIITAVAAYIAWTSPNEGSTETVEMIAGTTESLTQLSWHEERWDVSLRRKAAGENFDITVQRLNPPPKRPEVDNDDQTGEGESDAPKASETSESEAAVTSEPTAAGASEATAATGPGGEALKPAAPAEAPKPPEPAVTFPTTDKADEVIAKFAPLKAARNIGEVTRDKLAAMGLEKPAARLTLVFGDNEHVVQIGDATFGGGDLYAMRADGQVFLLPASTLSNIRHGASALQDKDVIGTKRDDVVQLNVNAGAATRELSQRHPKDEKTRFISDPAEPDQKLELASKWVERLWRLRVMRFADAAPKTAPALTVELFGEDGKALDVLQLWTPDDREAIAVSSRFETPVFVAKASADTLLKDVDALLAEGR